MRRSFLVLIVALAASPLPASAAPSPTSSIQSKIDPAAIEAADRMLTAMDYDHMMQRTCDAMVAQMGPIFRRAIEGKTGQQVDDALISKLTAIESEFLRDLLVNSRDVRRAIALLYAKEFTPAELDHLAELYRDPVMHKWTEVSPDMTAQMLPLIHGFAESHREELEARLKTAVSDYYAAKKRTPDS